ncbi:hypothetical protein ABZ865_06720 [Streptomyces sp. NPDC047085]|uniref:hypothetical protein n=1 Tax=Streptomyces sp. NPDC047085 TaxID=3155140 RepID=UPI0033D72ED3
MKARVISSLALPAALATAGLLNGAETAYAAALASDSLATSATHADQATGDLAVISGSEHPCTPIGNITITDYVHCCTPIGNITITDYVHCCTPIGNMTITDYHHCCTPVANLTFCDYGHHGHQYPFDIYPFEG